jgi:hypothetical protein
MKAPMAKMPMKMPAVKPMMNKGGAVKPKAMAKGGSVKKGKC